MARPTSDKKDFKIILRVNGETRSKIENLAKNMGCSISDCVRNIISEQKNSVLQNDYPINTESDAFVDLKSMTDYFGITMDSLLEMFDVALNEGSVVLNDGKLESAMPTWAEKLSDACHELGYDVEKIAESAVKSLGKGML